MGLEDELSGGEILYDKTRNVYVQLYARIVMNMKTASISCITLPSDNRLQEAFDYPLDQYSLFAVGNQELYEALPLVAQMKAKVPAGKEIYFVGVIYPAAFNASEGFAACKSSESDN